MPDLRSRRRTALLVMGALAVTAPALWRATRTARWRADVRYAAAELPRHHANAFRYVTPAAFERQAAALDSAVPRLSDAQVVWRLSALAALLEDGHTRVDRPRYTALLPLEVLWTDLGPWVIGADSAHAGLVGRRIVAVDGRPVSAVLDTLARYLPHENRWGLWSAAAGALVVPGALRDLGIAERPDALSLDLDAPGMPLGGAPAYLPDVRVPPTPEAVAAGRDPVLDWVRAQPQTPR